AGGDEHEVALDGFLAAFEQFDGDVVGGAARLVVVEAAAALQDGDAFAVHLGAHVVGLVLREALHAFVDGGEVDFARGEVGAQAHVVGAAHVGADAGGGDERLRGDAVVEHGRAAHSRVLHDGDLGTVLGADQRGLISGGAAAD